MISFWLMFSAWLAVMTPRSMALAFTASVSIPPPSA